MITASIIGGSGYAGGEVLRILLRHPEVQLKAVTSESRKGTRIARTHPNLRGFTEMQFSGMAEVTGDEDVVFIALPHGLSLPVVERLWESGTKLVDLGSDFRLRDPAGYLKWYGKEHARPDLLEQAVYGLPEVRREQVRKARLVACPGCLPTSTIIPLAPLVKEGMIKPEVVVDSKIGSSAHGTQSGASTHHPERSGTVRCYKPTGHRHIAEMEQELGLKVAFSPHAVELVRGIQTTAHAFLSRDVEEKDVWKVYRKAYANDPFVRIVKESSGVFRYPEPKMVMGTNFCDIGFEKDEHMGRLVVMSAIDNITKGSGGQAVQCMNLMFGLEESAGLWFPGLHPV